MVDDFPVSNVPPVQPSCRRRPWRRLPPSPPCTVSTIEGMSLDVKASKSDLVARLHLDAVTVQDMARPSDSPFRHMMYTMPDETSQHGGLVHVTYWESAGGVRRIPPSWIADTSGERYDQVLDARVSTLQVRRPPSLKGRIERVVCDPAQVVWACCRITLLSTGRFSSSTRATCLPPRNRFLNGVHRCLCAYRNVAADGSASVIDGARQRVRRQGHPILPGRDEARHRSARTGIGDECGRRRRGRLRAVGESPCVRPRPQAQGHPDEGLANVRTFRAGAVGSVGDGHAGGHVGACGQP